MKTKREKAKKPYLPMGHEDIAGVEGRQANPQWGSLVNAVCNIVPGNEAAASYEKAIEALLSALFYPALNYPVTQHEIYQGRKRIDISCTNMASDGFFKWLSLHYTAPLIFVECKNYGREVGNPELDQLSGRFSKSRGQVGLLVCRQFNDKNRFLQRCRDTALDGRGYIIALDDDDLRILVEARKGIMDPLSQKLLLQRFQALVS